jgi:hypothetical protein
VRRLRQGSERAEVDDFSAVQRQPELGPVRAEAEPGRVGHVGDERAEQCDEDEGEARNDHERGPSPTRMGRFRRDGCDARGGLDVLDSGDTSLRSVGYPAASVGQPMGRTSAMRVAFFTIVAAGALAAGIAVAGCGATDGAERTGSTDARAIAPVGAETPASGICAPKTTEPEVSVVLNDDTPIPRCVVVGPEQHLRIENRAELTTVTIAGFAATLAPGESVTVDRSFGEFLTPGVHTLQVSRFGGTGPQLWLRP